MFLSWWLWLLLHGHNLIFFLFFLRLTCLVFFLLVGVYWGSEAVLASLLGVLVVGRWLRLAFGNGEGRRRLVVGVLQATPRCLIISLLLLASLLFLGLLPHLLHFSVLPLLALLGHALAHRFRCRRLRSLLCFFFLALFLLFGAHLGKFRRHLTRVFVDLFEPLAFLLLSLLFRLLFFLLPLFALLGCLLELVDKALLVIFVVAQGLFVRVQSRLIRVFLRLGSTVRTKRVYRRCRLLFLMLVFRLRAQFAKVVSLRLERFVGHVIRAILLTAWLCLCRLGVGHVKLLLLISGLWVVRVRRLMFHAFWLHRLRQLVVFSLSGLFQVLQLLEVPLIFLELAFGWRQLIPVFTVFLNRKCY